jgi:hypothetical protein
MGSRQRRRPRERPRNCNRQERFRACRCLRTANPWARAPGTPLENRRRLTIDDLGALRPQASFSYTVEVKPDNSTMWNTIAVGRETPHVDIDRNQFPGAQRATIRVLRTTGVNEEVLAEATVDLH